MKYHIITYGCQMNKSDSERLATVLENLGYEPTNSEQSAGLVAVVACSVRQSAVDRIYGKVKIWNKIRKTRRLIAVLTGCVLNSDQNKLKRAFDFILDIKDLNKLPTLLKREAAVSGEYLSVAPKYESSFQAYVPISTGCNNYCSYCVVPYARGSEKHRPAEEIITEVKCLIRNCYKEIILLGQNVNSYCSPTNYESKRITNIDFPGLLKKINDLPGNFWLRFVTSHPKDLSDELINIMAHGEKICEYLHLPVQAGDDHILQAMNRHYTVAHYKDLIKKIRRAIPGIAISTDIIVGFPGETEEQFNHTAELMKEIDFDMAYLAEYSSRPGTAAEKLKDDIPLKEKRR
ncbi:MAG: tRNA (N6-isopentenyl adenosine(37)-C2)-methylthiotransferase MiaB, partial [Candidatus Parcubacteria bacterium]|nr:tRNA (N6-isopentenyl adenosine(37)-C2)-methylthiotransferase MiaB [Candidatus Parcubacteria bacterium]